ncbi:MAG TPA: DUF1552 domain-containing protein [Polyangiaceae bacterium]|nr:DUF1552 domain-containing protein [Polyangiaceae bacterium]
MNRRRFLRGLGGCLMALPLLEGFRADGARAQGTSFSFAIFMRQGNGVQQATSDGEPERFWPSFAPGPIDSELLALDSGRALSELAPHANSLSIVRGIRFNDPVNACKHSGGGNQVLTAAPASDDDCNSTLALGESLDNRITVQLGTPGDEPLTLFAGRKTGYLDEVLSYRGPGELRPAERDPFAVYQELFALSQLAPDEFSRLQLRRTSVNDLVREDMLSLLARTDLSLEDRARLDLHFTSIRDLENGISALVTDEQVANLQAAASHLDDDAFIESVVKLHCDVMTLAVASGAKRAATLQLGAGPDDTGYEIDGVRQPSFHQISHRADVAGAVDLHHKIDRKLLGLFKYLLDKLTAYQLPAGTLLDHGLAVFVSDVANKFHDYENIPYLVAGSAGGFLKTGLYVDAGGVTNNKILNTIGAAVGCTNADGKPLDDFGDPSLEKGFITDLLAGA